MKVRVFGALSFLLALVVASVQLVTCVSNRALPAPSNAAAVEHKLGTDYPAWSPIGDAGTCWQSNGPSAIPGWGACISGSGVVDGAVPGANFFGDGSDGVGTADGTTCDGGSCLACMTLSGGAYTQSRDCFFSSFTINNGVTVFEAGWRIWVANTLTCNGTISVEGGIGLDGAIAGAGGGGAGNSPMGGGTIGGVSGGTGGVLAGCSGGQGGCGNGGPSCAGGNTCTPVDVKHGGTPHDYLNAIRGWQSGINSATLSFVIVNGGTGGDSFGGLTPYGGGGGGGIGAVTARILIGNGHMSANGGLGSYGGGGGLFILGYRDASAWTGTVTATGGGRITDAGGAVGSNGLVLQFQL